MFSFLSDADFPSLPERPHTWREAVLGLRNEMTNHAVIKSMATLFSVNINIVDWEGVSFVGVF